MRNLKKITLVFALFLFSATAFAFNPIKPTNQLRAEIVELLGPNCPYEHNKNECKAQVLFTVNMQGEIIILSVDSPNERAESYIKSKLNYKSVSHKSKKPGEIYLLPLRMVRE